MSEDDKLIMSYLEDHYGDFKILPFKYFGGLFP